MLLAKQCAVTTKGASMGRRGRKMNTGRRRYASGRAVANRYPEPVYDKGSERVQAMRARFGEHYSSALGRAYAACLLGDEAEAQNRYQAGKRFMRLYARIIGGQSCRSALNLSPRGNAIPVESPYEAQEQAWLFAAMDDLDREGLRPWLDQLVSPLYTDAGPRWLDRLLAGGKDPADQMVLATAIKALDCVAPPLPPVGIRVA